MSVTHIYAVDDVEIIFFSLEKQLHQLKHFIIYLFISGFFLFYKKVACETFSNPGS